MDMGGQEKGRLKPGGIEGRATNRSIIPITLIHILLP